MPDTNDLQTRFEAAEAQSKLLPERPDNVTLLKIYGLYKQATQGANAEKRPSFSDFVARAKWDAWTAQKSLSADDAKQGYIDLIDSLRG
ncbi:acyl-CoA-binding protein [Variovorax sp. PAMC 28711]|uniref:acyl-CoA-binding protein n=1 Tax=Variovorax sp. PAMC 28711 TaxID=1795631 RepID=UPI00078C9960|nr:acyl-CoA-binding protein [Variovorax sp. PAMC 28711]AMM24220.1 acyl-CoA-binding protein [Variovorax sp. PAMC 28711]